MKANRERRARALGEEAAGQILPLMMGMLLFMGGYVALTQVSIENRNRAVGEVGPNMELEANRLAETILGQPGISWYSTVTCANGIPTKTGFQPDSLDRFGLGLDHCPDVTPPTGFNLSFDKFANLG